MRQADTGVLMGLITLVTGGLTWRSRLHPLWLLGGGTLLGLLLRRRKRPLFEKSGAKTFLCWAMGIVDNDALGPD